MRRNDNNIFYTLSRRFSAPPPPPPPSAGSSGRKTTVQLQKGLFVKYVTIAEQFDIVQPLLLLLLLWKPLKTYEFRMFAELLVENGTAVGRFFTVEIFKSKTSELSHRGYFSQK